MDQMHQDLYNHYNSSLDEIYISPESKNSEVAQRFSKLFPNKIKFFSTIDKIKSVSSLSPEEFSASKRRVLIRPHEGKFFKQCPGQNHGSTCCNYFVLNLGSQCHFNCSYCYLQSFLNTPFLVIYSNLDDALEELTEVSQKMGEHSIRVGTGEVIDSLGLDPLTLYSQKIIEHLKNLPNIKLELKTKSNFVNHLLEIGSKNTTISWSINPHEIIEKEELQTASMEERILAAKNSLNAGYTIGFHIDPVIWHPEWKQNYSQLVDEIIKNFTPKNIAYLSLGALRFDPEQRHIMKDRFDRSSYVNNAELFISKDKKLRYDKDLRSEMFKFIIDRFKSNSRSWKIFLCMESPETWLSTYGDFPKKVDGLKELFSTKPSL